MRSNEVTNETNGSDSERHTGMRDGSTTSEFTELLRDDSKGRQDDDVNLRVTKESEQVLEGYGITTIDEVTKQGSYITLSLSEQNGDTSTKDGKSRYQQERDYEDTPTYETEVQDVNTSSSSQL